MATISKIIPLDILISLLFNDLPNANTSEVSLAINRHFIKIYQKYIITLRL
ncbi:hypothetical protein BOVMAS02_07100 [Streptococcus uberis]